MTKLVADITNAMTKEVLPEHVEALKKALTDNDFKHTFMGASILLSGLSDLGMPLEQKLFWEKVALSL